VRVFQILDAALEEREGLVEDKREGNPGERFSEVVLQDIPHTGLLLPGKRKNKVN